MIRAGLVVFGLAALVLAGIALFDPNPQDQRRAVTTPEGSDYYMRSARVTEFDADGRLRYRLTAEQSLHFPDDSAEFTGLDVHYPSGDRGVWDLHADRGVKPPDSRDILLTGNVLLTHNPDSPEPLRVATARAWLRPEANRADTEAQVVARSPGRRARGEGMTVFFDREALTLHRDVRVTYQPR